MVSAEGSIDPAPRFAIVGYAARFPGAPDADEFWEVLREGRDAISEVPKDRWYVDEFFDPDPGAPGKVVTRRAGFVDDVTGYPPPFNPAMHPLGERPPRVVCQRHYHQVK